MSTFQERLQIEKSDLDEKIEKLSEFLPSEKFKEIAPTQQQLLHRQIAFMQGYSDVLKDRLEDLDRA